MRFEYLAGERMVIDFCGDRCRSPIPALVMGQTKCPSDYCAPPRALSGKRGLTSGFASPRGHTPRNTSAAASPVRRRSS